MLLEKVGIQRFLLTLKLILKGTYTCKFANTNQ